jgi:anti-sigma B factor antagonist
MSRKRLASWTVCHEPDACVLVVQGELELTSSEALADAAVHLATALDRGMRLIIDLEGVRFLDSTGLRALLRIHTHTNDALVLRSPVPRVRRLLEITVPEVFTIQ